MSDAVPVQTLREGRYAIIGVLGSGSQAETLDAVDKRDGRAVAIKRFQVRGAKGWKDVELAEREARVLSTLSHPNLPVYIEHFEEDGALYLVMQKIEGETLASRRKRRAALSNEDVARFLSDADGVLRYLHSRVPPIIHRDIKPGNVIRRADGSFAFVDFGSVRDQLKPEGGSTVVGTFGYMAPEQFQGRALPGSDVYAVAATVLTLVTGREPEDLPHRGLAIDVPAALGKGAEGWLVRALSAMLEPDPDKRPAQVSGRPPTQRTAERQSSSSSDERRRRVERESRGGSASGRGWQRPEPWDLHDIRDAGREQRRAMRDETRRVQSEIKQQIKDETRRARRAAREFRDSRFDHRRYERHGFGPAAPLLISIVVLALTAARVATFALFRFFLPIFLTLLSIPLFSPGLRRAAWRAREIGQAGDRGLVHAIEAVRGRMLDRDGNDGSDESDGVLDDDEQEDAGTSESAPRVRVTEKPKIRVNFGAATEDAEPDDVDDQRRRREQR
ncbi:MAG: serine/threonine-protein kinase [Pseudomonadota bacterium]